jgi:3-oxoacyl-[acyl-carrier-protein] synthase-3
VKSSFSQRQGSLQIIGTGAAVPDPSKITDNDTVLQTLREHGVDIGNKVGIDTQNLTGIAHRSLEDRDSFDFALDASTRAIEAAKATDPSFSQDQLGIIVSGGSTPDWVYPSCACRLQGALLGADSCEAFDISLACSSGIAGLNIVGSRMRDLGFKYGLVAFGESIATRSNTPTSMNHTLWGNAGGAFVVRLDPEGDPRYGLFADTIISDGQYSGWTRSAGIGAHPSNVGQTPNASMEGHEKDIHRYGLRMVPRAIQKFLDENGVSDNLYLFPHNSNLKMMVNIGKEIGLPEERVLSRISEQGNTSSASILSSLDYFVRERHFKKDDVLIFAAFGGGMAMALSLYRWS